MNSDEIVANLQPEMIESFKRAVELGKWPDGNALSPEQREICLQTVIAWEYHNLPPEARTGYVPPKESACAHPPNAGQSDAASPLKWQGDEKSS